MIFKKNKINIEKLAKKISEEINLSKACLQFVEDSGNYKKIQNHYRLSDYEVKEKLKEIKNQILTMQINMEVAIEVISKSKKQTELFVQITKDLNQLFLNQKNKINKKEK